LLYRTIKEFDEAVVVPMFGYKDVDEYYNGMF
jgi:predicted alpha/beta-fold hydrolase